MCLKPIHISKGIFIEEVSTGSTQEKIQQLREELLVIEEYKIAGRMGYALDDVITKT